MHIKFTQEGSIIKEKILMALAFVLLVCLYAGIIQAQYVPNVINYQGRLTDDMGTPINGTTQIAFRILDADTVNAVYLWGETLNNVQVNNGYYNVQLGSLANPLQPSNLSGTTLYLQITVGGEILRPRTMLTSVPFAHRAGSVSNNSIGSAQVQYKSLGADDIQDVFVLNTGDTITGNLQCTAGLQVGASVVVGGNVIAGSFIGDGSGLNNIPAPSQLWEESIANIYYSDGDVAIGNEYSLGWMLRVDGTAGKPGGGSWGDSSDARLKRNIRDIDSREALEKLLQIKGVNYEWINPDVHQEGVHAGVIAQNLEDIFPGWVQEIEPQDKDRELVPQGEKVKSISFPHDFNAYLIEALRAQQQQIDQLEDQVQTLKQDLDDIKRKEM